MPWHYPSALHNGQCFISIKPHPNEMHRNDFLATHHQARHPTFELISLLYLKCVIFLAVIAQGGSAIQRTVQVNEVKKLTAASLDAKL